VPPTFPFASVRRGQREFLEDALAAVSEGKHLVAQAPTGLGKTAVALAASLDSAMREGRLVLFLTSRQTQHRIVVETLRRIRSRSIQVKAVDIVSKQSMCPHPSRPRNSRAFQEYCGLMTKSRGCRFLNHQSDAVTREVLEDVMHVQELQTHCLSRGVCPHKVALEAAKDAHVVVCDYNYVFSRQRELILSRLGRKPSELIVVIDEAHNLPDRIRSQLCGNLSPRQLMRGAKDARAVDPQLADILALLSKSVDGFLAKVQLERRVDRRLFADIIDTVSAGGPWNLETLSECCTEVGEKLASRGEDTVLLDIAAFLSSWRESGSWMVHMAVGGAEKHLGYRLLDPSVLSRDIFAKVHSSILMSGTLHPGEMYANLLGLEEGRAVLRTYPSPFPPENRLTVVTPHLTTLYQKRSESMMRALAVEVAGIAEACPGNLAAFFPSYDLLARVAGKLRSIPVSKQILAENPEWDKTKRDQAVLRLRELKGRGGALLLGVLGGSFSEGIDYNDNLLSCVIIGGLPISPPTVETKALNDYYASKFGAEKGYQYAYLYPAMNKILQAAGRCIRGEKDRAVVAILDNRLLSPRYASCLPAGFDVRRSNGMQGEVRTFFYGGRYGQRNASEERSGGRADAGEVARAGGCGEVPRSEEVPEPAA